MELDTYIMLKRIEDKIDSIARQLNIDLTEDDNDENEDEETLEEEEGVKVVD